MMMKTSAVPIPFHICIIHMIMHYDNGMIAEDNNVLGKLTVFHTVHYGFGDTAVHKITFLVTLHFSFQCFDTVGWVTGRAFSL